MNPRIPPDVCHELAAYATEIQSAPAVRVSMFDQKRSPLRGRVVEDDHAYGMAVRKAAEERNTRLSRFIDQSVGVRAGMFDRLLFAHRLFQAAGISEES